MDRVVCEIIDGVIVNTIGPEADVADLTQFINENIDAWVGQPLIWDANQLNFGRITPSMTRQFARSMKVAAEKRSGDRSAIVARKDLHFGMMRLATTVAASVAIPIEYNVFRTHEEARAWLLDDSE